MSGKDQRTPGTTGGNNYLDYTTEGLTDPGASAAKTHPRYDPHSRTDSRMNSRKKTLGYFFVV